MLATSTVLFFTPNTIEYVKPPVALAEETCERECIESKIDHYAEMYNVSPITMNHIVKCESGYNPDALNNSPKEYSVGLVQINLKAHTTISDTQARDVDYALNFLGRELSQGNGKIWTCWYLR